MGVYYDIRKQKWVARKQRKGENIYIGSYSTEFDADTALDAYLMTGERLRQVPGLGYLQPEPLEEPAEADFPVAKELFSPTSYPSYEQLRQQHTNQVHQLTAKYSKGTTQ